MVARESAAPVIELADIIRRYGPAYERSHYMRGVQHKALWAIVACRTAALGGHHEWCENCGFERYLYHSCRNRHCPKCQTLVKEAWLEARQRELLPVPYFHNIFTLPHELNPLILWSERNQRALLKLLFDAAAQTLLQFGENELGGQIGFLMVLHTWDQQLRAHYHVHCLIASGALANDGSRWIAGGRQFLFKVCALSKVFRGKYLAGVKQLLLAGELDLPTSLSVLAEKCGRQSWLRRLYGKRWVVYSKPPFAGPQKLLDYLGRYTHRVAISNERLISCENDEVTFSFRDRRDADRRKIARIPAETFIERFLQHVLPDGFVRIRHYGFLANRNKTTRLARCRELIGAQPPPPAEEKSLAQRMQELLGIDFTRCPCCHEPLEREALPPQHLTTAVTIATSSVPSTLWDTS